jgi:hypothetical protein
MGDIIPLDAWRQSAASSLQQFGETIGRLLPAIAGAVLILLIGWGVSRLVQAMVRRTLHRFGLDRAALHLRVTEGLQRANVTTAYRSNSWSPSGMSQRQKLAARLVIVFTPRPALLVLPVCPLRRCHRNGL